MPTRAYVFKLYPTRAQGVALGEQLATHRRLYNQALAERKTAWETERRTVTYGEQSATLKTQRRGDPALARANFSSCQRTLKRLDRSFAAFFRRVRAGQTPGYPRFKGAHRFDTVEYTHTDGCRFFGASLYLQHIGRVKVKRHRATAGAVKAVAVTRKADGWHCAVVCVQAEPEPAASAQPPAGIDLGLTHFLVTSAGEAVAPHRAYRRARGALRRAQRRVARRKKDSARRRKAVAQLQRQHLKVTRQRADFHHKTALALTRQYGLIAHEDLNIAGIARSLGGRLAKSALDAGWGQFLSILGHKAEGAGVRVVAVPPAHTSQRCSACGALPAQPKTLRDRVHTCPCGYTADRDHNAARNILLLATGSRPGQGRQGVTTAVAAVP